MERKDKVYKIILLIILTAFITFMCTSVALYKMGYLNDTKYVMLSAGEGLEGGNLSLDLLRIRELINQKFLGEIDDEKLRENAIKGYVEGLEDEYTEYMTKEEVEDFYEQALGNFDGIGIYMAEDKETNAIMVISPIKNSPAFKAGILPGDLIVKVDDISCVGEASGEVSKRIKGEPGTSVKLEIVRNNSETIIFDIVREQIKLHFVEGEVLENSIGYMEVVSFDEETSTQFKAKYEELKAQNIKGLIIDLRNNPGGLVDEALAVADMFVPYGEKTLLTVNRAGEKKEYKSKDEYMIDIPVVILVNENSASASEILAGTLKDYGKATIVGTKTYGKGVIQEFLRLADGSGLKITTSEYLTPKENKINKIGIEPDHNIELPEDVINVLAVEKEKDTQLKKAVELLK